MKDEFGMPVREASAGQVVHLPGPVLALRPKEEAKHHRGVFGNLQHASKQGERGGVGPVQVVENQRQAPCRGQAARPLAHDLERLVLEALRRKIGDLPGDFRLKGETQHRRQIRVDFCCPVLKQLIKRRTEFDPKFRLRVDDRDAQPLSQEVEEREVGEVSREGKAASLQPKHVRVCPLHFRHQAGLPDTSLTDDRDDLPAPLDPPGLAGDRTEPITSAATTGASFPFSVSEPTARRSKSGAISRVVASDARMVPGAAVPCSRAAVFTVSPRALYAICRTSTTRDNTTGPVLRPIRTCSGTP